MRRHSLHSLWLIPVATLLPGSCSRAEPPRDVVVITLDTTRADHLSCYGYPASVTPHLDALAARGLVFERVYAPMSQTLPAHCTLFTGREPREHGVLENWYRLGQDEITLAERLGGEGYRTGAFVAAAVLSADTGLGQGFSAFDSPDNRPSGWRDGAEVTDTALAWADTLADSPEPYLLWVHYFDAHESHATPVDMGVPFASEKERVTASAAFKDEPIDKVLKTWQAYANAVAYQDAEVGRLLEGLRQRGLLDKAVIAVVADHGEGLFEHGLLGHGMHVFEPMVRVPLILAAPDAELAGVRVPATIHMRDILATLLDVARRPLPPEATGLNLMPVLRAQQQPPQGPTFLERPHYTQERLEWRAAGKPLQWGVGFLGAVIMGDEKLVRYPDGTETLFDLATDPHELADLSAQRPERRAKLAALLTEWNAQEEKVDRSPDAEASEARHRALRQLGY